MVSLAYISDQHDHEAMQGNLQMGPHSFLRRHVVHICLGDTQSTLIGWSTADTIAFLVDRSEVVGEASVTKVKRARRYDCISEALAEISM